MAKEKTKILVATTNPGKMAELSAMLDLDVDWLSLAEFPDAPDVVEDGRTFQSNARKKALGYARATGCRTIADDSGLVVDALDGAPGVKSARFSGEPTKDENRTLLDHNNMGKVLKLLKDVPTEKKTARFVCSLCLASPKDILIETQGIFEGVIAQDPAGCNGFGYDPIFFVPSMGKTAAQISREEKNAISHRGIAIRKIRPLLAEIIANRDTET